MYAKQILLFTCDQIRTNPVNIFKAENVRNTSKELKYTNYTLKTLLFCLGTNSNKPFEHL